MPRNLDTRVELVAPVEDAALRDEVIDALERCLADNANAWDLGDDGTWRRRERPADGVRSVHAELMEFALERSADG